MLYRSAPWIFLGLMSWVTYLAAKRLLEVDSESFNYKVVEHDIVSDLPGVQLHLQTPAL